MTNDQARQAVKHWANCEDGGAMGRQGPFKGENAEIQEEATMTKDEMMAWKCWELVMNVLAQWRFPEVFRRYLYRATLWQETPETFRPAVHGFYEPRSRKDAICMIQIQVDDFWPLLELKTFPSLHAPFVSTE